MANKDDQTTDEEVVDSADEVENEGSDDSSVEDSTTEDAGEETDDEADDSDSDEESEEPEQFERRFTQFKGETPNEYLKQLENAYAKSTTEGQRLFQEVETLKEEVMNITANQSDDDDGEQKNKTSSLAESYWLKDYRKRARQDYDDFVEKHPELSEDTALAQRLQKKVALANKIALEDEGEPLDMGEALRIGWSALGYDNSQDNDTDSRQAIKERTSVSKTTNRKKKAKKEIFSPEQLAVAKRMYPNKTDSELSELLAKHKA